MSNFITRALRTLLRANATRHAGFSGRSSSRKLGLELLETRDLMATFGLDSVRVRSSDDFFAIENNNPIDYTDDDRVNQGFDDLHITGVSLGGQYNFTTLPAGQIYLHHPGYGAVP